MEAMANKLYSELRTIKAELLTRLERGDGSPFVNSLIREELKDIDYTLRKIERGHYGLCEISGELIPESILREIPTIHSMDDIDVMSRYYCKSIDY